MHNIEFLKTFGPKTWTVSCHTVVFIYINTMKTTFDLKIFNFYQAF